jgi:hypothetical protein
MRGRQAPQESMLAFVDLEGVPPDLPLRTVKRFADEALARLSRAHGIMPLYTPLSGSWRTWRSPSSALFGAEH